MTLLVQSPLDPDFVQNPYPFYARTRALGPVHFWQDYNMLAAFDHATVHALLRDKRLGRARPLDQSAPSQDHLQAFDAIEEHSMLDMEGNRHKRLRSLVLRAFTSKRVANLAPDIRNICTDLIAAFPRGAFDLLPAYCSQVPVRVIARLLGVPEAHAPDLLRWSSAMVAMYQASRTVDTEHAANTAAAEFNSYLRDYIKVKRNHPADDLITRLIAAEEDGEKLNTDELIGTCVLLLNAGHEATVHSLGLALKTLLEHNTDRAALAPDAIANTTEELLRFDPPLHMFTRFAYEDISLGGHILKAGQQVALMLGAAGRDPALLNAPDTFDPIRKTPAHLAFGGGVHFCVGAPLARLEMHVALPMLFDAHPDLALAATPEFANTYHFHQLKALIVTP
ncbi:cytochrome P450 [Ascidiaceihabitans sp.]|uniref:cytochrome P450 n=1 Tax=Ascidiaceihabitans sp. TaxID=1872644 RepID=UPI003297389C